MHTIIAIALVSATQALLQCSDYCKFLSYNQPMKWRPDCNCSIRNKEKLQINPLLSNPPNLLYDANAGNIYYEPAERYRMSFLDQPFILINPTAPAIAQQSSPLSRRGEREINRSVTKNNKRGRVHKISIETEDLPLYLDIDIHSKEGQGRSISQDLMKNKVEDINKTELDLMKCIDLNVFMISRRNGIPDDDIETLNSKNMELYSGMSDSDLMAVLNEKCDLPTSIIEQSLHEIKSNWPKKNISTKLKNDDFQEVIYETHQKEFMNFSKDVTTDSSYVKRTIANDSNKGVTIKDYINHSKFFHENARKNFGTDSTSPEVKDEKNTFSRTNIEDTLNDQDDVMTTTKYYRSTTNNIYNDNSSNKYGDFLERPAFEKEKSNNNHLFTTDLSFSEIENGTSSTESVSTSENVPMNDEDMSNLTQYISDQKEETIDELNLDLISENPIETLSRINIDDSKVKKNVEKKINKFFIEDNMTSATVRDISTTRGNRSQYLEGEYQIPKIISKELPNNTIISEVDGNETILNFDFVEYSNVLNNSSENTSQTIDGVTSKYILDSEFTTASNIVQVTTDNDNIQAFSSHDLKINGELFFQYGHSKIPARFVQNSDGKINVAIDGASICDELFKRGEQKSLLVTSLCNCVQSQNCTRS